MRRNRKQGRRLATTKSAPNMALSTPVDDALEELIMVSGFSNDVSMLVAGSATDRAHQLASMVHAKACAHGRSIGFVCRSNMFDHSAVLGLARAIIECLTMYVYLIEPLSDDQWAFRYAVLRLHDTSARIKLLRAWPKAGETDDLKAGRDELIAEIKAHYLFETFDEAHQRRLVSGETLFVSGMRRAAALAGWDADVFTALYGYFSSHLHAAPMSFFRMDDHQVDYFFPNAAQKSIASLGIAVAAASLRRLSLLHLGNADYSADPVLTAVMDGMRKDDCETQVFGHMAAA